MRNALITILIAGHDTTALAVAWALADIVPRPEVVDRLADELRRVIGGGPPEAEHLPALEYLDGAIRESLRRSPVVPFVVRKTVRPFAAGGREYPAGVVLCPCTYLVHRRGDLYPEPDRFRPSGSWSGSSARTSGSPSAAATGSAWGCRSRSTR